MRELCPKAQNMFSNLAQSAENQIFADFLKSAVGGCTFPQSALDGNEGMPMVKKSRLADPEAMLVSRDP
jgi:hypothetical protein